MQYPKICVIRDPVVYLDYEYQLLNLTALLNRILALLKSATLLKSVHFKKPVTRSSFLSKSIVIFNITTTNMTMLFERNEDRVTGFLSKNCLKFEYNPHLTWILFNKRLQQNILANLPDSTVALIQDMFGHYTPYTFDHYCELNSLSIYENNFNPL